MVAGQVEEGAVANFEDALLYYFLARPLVSFSWMLDSNSRVLCYSPETESQLFQSLWDLVHQLLLDRL